MDGAGGNPPRGTKWAELLSTADGGEVCCRRRELGVCDGDVEAEVEATALALVVEDLGRKLEADETGWMRRNCACSAVAMSEEDGPRGRGRE